MKKHNKMKNTKHSKKECKKMKNKISYKIKDPNTMKIVNGMLDRDKQKIGLWRTKEQYKDIKYRKYAAENGVKNTIGGWENKIWCNTKSNWQKNIEDKISNGTYKEPTKKDVKIKILQAVILYENKNYDVYKAEIEKTSKDIIVKIIYGAHHKKLPVRVEKPKIDEIDNEMWKLALIYNAEIYKIVEIL